MHNSRLKRNYSSARFLYHLYNNFTITQCSFIFDIPVEELNKKFNTILKDGRYNPDRNHIILKQKLPFSFVEMDYGAFPLPEYGWWESDEVVGNLE